MELFTITLFAFIIALFIVCLGYLTSGGNDRETKSIFTKRNVKFVPQKNLFFESLKKVRLELRRHDHIQEYGTVFGHMMMGVPTIVVSDPELIELIMSKHFTNFVNRRVSISICYVCNISNFFLFFSLCNSANSND